MVKKKNAANKRVLFLPNRHQKNKTVSYLLNVSQALVIAMLVKVLLDGNKIVKENIGNLILGFSVPLLLYLLAMWLLRFNKTKQKRRR